MVEAVMLWNEPNNLSHWDFEIDPEWRIFSEMVKAGVQRGRRRAAGSAARARRNVADRSRVRAHPGAAGRARCRRRGCGAWLPARLESLAARTSGRTSFARFEAVTELPLWVSEVGVSTFGAEEVQEFG